MKHHDVYFKFFGKHKSDFVACELCSGRASEIHHIDHGANGRKNNIENLAAVCHGCHFAIHNSPGGKMMNQRLKQIHLEKVQIRSLWITNNDKNKNK